jgi:hypothetical protein
MLLCTNPASPISSSTVPRRLYGFALRFAEVGGSTEVGNFLFENGFDAGVVRDEIFAESC